MRPMKIEEILLKSEDYPKLFEKSELIPAIVQDGESGEVLMLAYMNETSFKKTLETKLCTFWSRSRQTLWTKGETSGHFMEVLKIFYDCDLDSLLFWVRPKGPACHTGNKSCFYREFPINSQDD